MLTITPIMICAVVVYHEARSTSFKEQVLVGSSIYTRSIENKTSLQKQIFKKHAYTSILKYPNKKTFNNLNQYLNIYNLKDYNSWVLATQACNIAYDYSKINNINYYHDKTIKDPYWSKDKNIKLVQNTKSFKFYSKI